MTSWRASWRLDRANADAMIVQVGFNLAQLVIPVFLLLPAGIPVSFSAAYLLPGYAAGYLVGSLGLVALGYRLGRREGRGGARPGVTAHAYGNNVPAILAYTLSIMLPVYQESGDPLAAWRVGAAAVIWTGVFKLLVAPFADRLRRLIPVPASMTVFAAAMYSYLALILLPRMFAQPALGLLALGIVLLGVFARLPLTRWRLPPFLVAWLLPLGVGWAGGYLRPEWTGLAFTLPGVISWGVLSELPRVAPYFSVIVPMSLYHILQDIAAVEGAAGAGDNYDARQVLLWDGLGTLVCGLCGSTVAPIVYAMHPAYKAVGARLSYQIWTPVVVLAVVVSGLSLFVTFLFPWSVISAMVAYVAIGVGGAALKRVEPPYYPVLLLGLVLPTGAVIMGTLNSALSALRLSPSDPAVFRALEDSIYWSSVQGLGQGFLFLVLVVAAVTTCLIEKKFAAAARWCAVAALASWVGVMHAPRLAWGAAPDYALGWAALALLTRTAPWWTPPDPLASGLPRRGRGGERD